MKEPDFTDKGFKKEYKGYVISMAPLYTRFKWQYVHKEYDGPEDDRLGYCNTIEQCIEEIDEKNEDI